MENDKTIALTISRQTASGGSYIAHALARKLGFRYLDNEVLYKAAKLLGADERELSGREERVSGFIENIVRSFSFGTPEAAYVPPSRRPVYDRELFDAEARIIQEVAGSCNAVVVGRAGFNVLKGCRRLVNVFIHAPLGFRIKRLMEFRNISDRAEARSVIEESDGRREKFIRDMAGIDWTDARNYHMCIDTSAAGLQASEEMILGLVAAKRHSFESAR